MMKEVQQQDRSPKFRDSFVFRDVGDYVEGILGPRAEVKTKFGPRVRYIVGDYVVWANRYLDSLLKGVSEGKKVGIEYTGLQVSKHGGYQFRTYKVYVEVPED